MIDFFLGHTSISFPKSAVGGTTIVTYQTSRHLVLSAIMCQCLTFEPPAPPNGHEMHLFFFVLAIIKHKMRATNKVLEINKNVTA